MSVCMYIEIFFHLVITIQLSVILRDVWPSEKFLASVLALRTFALLKKKKKKKKSLCNCYEQTYVHLQYWPPELLNLMRKRGGKPIITREMIPRYKTFAGIFLGVLAKKAEGVAWRVAPCMRKGTQAHGLSPTKVELPLLKENVGGDSRQATYWQRQPAEAAMVGMARDGSNNTRSYRTHKNFYGRNFAKFLSMAEYEFFYRHRINDD